METANDKWIEAIPEGRNDPCPCGCGKKWKKVAVSDESLNEHFNNFKNNITGE